MTVQFFSPRIHSSTPLFDRAETASLRAFTRFISTRISPLTLNPYSSPRRAIWAAYALATSVLVGMHPVFTQVPPNLWRSMMATVLPAAAKRAARDGPAWPVPMMMASKCFMRPLRLGPRLGAYPLALPLRESFHLGVPRCRRRTIPTSGAWEPSVHTCHDVLPSLVTAPSASGRRNC